MPLLDAAAALAWLLPWLMLCNSARANTNANTNRLKHCLATYSYLVRYHVTSIEFLIIKINIDRNKESNEQSTNSDVTHHVDVVDNNKEQTRNSNIVNDDNTTKEIVK